jgi:hypothetical protein
MGFGLVLSPYPASVPASRCFTEELLSREHFGVRWVIFKDDDVRLHPAVAARRSIIIS